jgi:L-asparaginase
MSGKPDILIIYTGGTIGMIQDPSTGDLMPFQFDHLLEQIPELNRLDVNLSSIAFEQPVDSSNMTPEIWQNIAQTIIDNRHKFHGFVVLHGSDTMAYTASALSFMLQGLAKPVILTGSQLPMGIIRTDGKENFITAIEIAGARYTDGTPIVQEVAVYFEYRLYRGNRTKKVSATHFNAIDSPNYPPLAEAGVDIRYHREALLIPENIADTFDLRICDDVHVIRIYPGMTRSTLIHALNTPDMVAVVLETFGAGNAPSAYWFQQPLKDLIEKGVTVVNVTQCLKGSVNMAKYTTGRGMLEAGVVSGWDITLEAALCKLKVLAGRGYKGAELAQAFSLNMAGEFTFSANGNGTSFPGITV